MFPQMNKIQLLGQLEAIRIKIKMSPEEDQLPLRYPKEDLRSVKNSYRKKDPTRAQGTGMSGRLARRLPKAERLLNEALTAPSFQSDSARALASMLTRLREEELTEPWTYTQGARKKNLDTGEDNKGDPIDPTAKGLRLNKNNKRSRYKNGIRGHFLKLLSLIKIWVKQNKNLTSTRSGSMSCKKFVTRWQTPARR